MHGQTLRMSLAFGRNVRAVLRRPLHARDAEQRSGRRRNAPGPIQQVCERERRPPANQADGAARMYALRICRTPRVRRLIRNVSCDMKLHSVLLGWSNPDQVLRVTAGTPRKHASDGRWPSGRYCQGCEAFPVM